ncbi:MAG: NusG domain II-containing protein [Oscillospiraceae bacterium]|nr:NusG domain II-containing protein [Oscillospiraceae bacterium]
MSRIRRGRAPRPTPHLSTRAWAMIFGAMFLLLAGLTALQYLGAKPASTAEIWVDGVLLRTIDLSQDGEYRIESAEGWNVLSVSGGKLAVTAASCPDADCVRCGPQNSGPPIVCLPNRVSIQFSDSGGVDGAVR